MGRVHVLLRSGTWVTLAARALDEAHRICAYHKRNGRRSFVQALIGGL